MGAMGAGSETPLTDPLISHFEECYRLTPLIARRQPVREPIAEKGPAGVPVRPQRVRWQRTKGIEYS